MWVGGWEGGRGGGLEGDGRGKAARWSVGLEERMNKVERWEKGGLAIALLCCAVYRHSYHLLVGMLNVS